MITKLFISIIAATSILPFSGICESVLGLTIQSKPSQANSTDLDANFSQKYEFDAIISKVKVSQRIISMKNRQKELDKTDTQQAMYKGRFKVVYLPLKKLSNKVWQSFIVRSGMYEKIAYSLNRNLVIPRDITIVSSECNSPNAFYYQEKHAIFICYELVEQLAKFNYRYAISKEEFCTSILLSIEFIFMHEMGHALIHELNLPVLGREEDAADQLGTILFSYGGSNKEIGIAAITNLLKENGQGVEQLRYWDEHSLDEQRYYNIICWFYGSNPLKYANLPTFAGLPATRTKHCPSEYKQALYSWGRLLQPYFIQRSNRR